MANAVPAGPGLPEQRHRSLGSAVDAVRLQVDPDNVMTVMRVLVAESDRLLDSVRRARSRGPWVGQCGGDPVSRDAASAFNQRIDQLVEQCRRYAEELGQAGHSLAAIARDYGHTDAEIQAVLSSAARPDNPAP